MRSSRLGTLALAAMLVLTVSLPAFGEPVVVRLLTWAQGPQLEQEKEIYLSFNKVQDRIRVELESIPSGIQEKATLMMIAGDPPDIIMTHQNRHWQWAHANMVMDLTPWIKRDGLDKGIFPPGVFEPYLDKAGRITGIPMFIATRVTAYNKGLFDQAGLPYPNEKSTLLGDILESAKKITRDVSGDGNPDYWGIEPAYMVNFVWRLWGSTYVTPQRDAFALNNRIGLESLGFMRDLVATWRVAPSLSSVTTYWAQGRTGMTWCNQLEAMAWSHKLPDVWDIALIPLGPTQQRVMDIATWGFTIPVNAPHPQEAWEVLRWMLTREIQEQLIQRGRAGIRMDVITRYYQRLDPLKSGYQITPGSFQNRHVITESFQNAPFDYVAGLPLPSDSKHRKDWENPSVPLTQLLNNLEIGVNAALQEQGLRK